jgi:ribosomal protein S25
MSKEKNKGSKAAKKPKQNQGNATAKKAKNGGKKSEVCQENGILPNVSLGTHQYIIFSKQ